MNEKRIKHYHVFARTWWRKNASYPGGLEPHPGQKRTICTCSSEAEAQEACEQWNRNNTPGKLSRKAEYQAVYW